MPKLYIGNATRQVIDFQYWVPEGRAARSVKVPIGAQAMIPGDLNTPAIDSIIEQHLRYGIVNVDSIDRTKVFTGVCYSVDKPLPASKIQRLMLVNQTELVKAGAETRKQAAIASSEALQADLDRQGIPERVEAFVTEIEEVDTPQQADYAPFQEGVRVERTPAEGGGPKGGLRQRGRKAA